MQERDRGVRLIVCPLKDAYGTEWRQAMKKTLSEQRDDHPLELLKTFPVVIGSRYVHGGGANWDLRRKALSFGANLYARLLCGVPVHDMTAASSAASPACFAGSISTG